MSIVLNESLTSMLKSFNTLYDVLSMYSGIEDDLCKIIDELAYNDVIYTMSKQNNMSEDEMSNWIKQNANEPVTCKIIIDKGSAGGWPVVQILCKDKIFLLDWVDE